MADIALNKKGNPQPDDEITYGLKLKKAKRSLLIVGIISIVMMFSGLTSAYIVSRGGAPYWVNITMPSAFWVSTVFIVLSSLTMILAVRAVKRDNKPLLNGMLLSTLILGLLFVNSQLNGWGELVDRGLNLTGNFLEQLKGEYGKDYYITDQQGLIVEYKDGKFFDPQDPMGKEDIDQEIRTMRNPAATYMNFLTGLHAAHVGGGLLYLIYVVILGLIGHLDSQRSLKVTQLATYWHFVDILWVYLLLFLYFIH